MSSVNVIPNEMDCPELQLGFYQLNYITFIQLFDITFYIPGAENIIPNCYSNHLFNLLYPYSQIFVNLPLRILTCSFEI